MDNEHELSQKSDGIGIRIKIARTSKGEYTYETTIHVNAPIHEEIGALSQAEHLLQRSGEMVRKEILWRSERDQ